MIDCVFSSCVKCGEMFPKSSLLQLHTELADKNGGICPVKKIRSGPDNRSASLSVSLVC